MHAQDRLSNWLCMLVHQSVSMSSEKWYKTSQTGITTHVCENNLHLHTYLKMTEVAPFCAHFQSFNSSNTVGYLLEVFFRLWILFWSVYPLLHGASTENLRL